MDRENGQLMEKVVSGNMRYYCKKPNDDGGIWLEWLETQCCEG